jgi:hypothetical protein
MVNIKMLYNCREIKNDFIKDSYFSYKFYNGRNVYTVENEEDRKLFFQLAEQIAKEKNKSEVCFNLYKIDDKSKIVYANQTELEKIISKLKVLQ